MDDTKSKKVLVVSSHPDDETLGCGGTILRHRSIGDKADWLIMTEMKVEDGYKEGMIHKRKREIELVSKEYGFNEIFLLGFSTRKLDQVPVARIVEDVSRIIQTAAPDIVYLPFCNDVHSDHRITFDVAISSMKTFRTPYVKKILMYEAISETEFAPPIQGGTFAPNFFVDISNYLEKKLSIIELYGGETQDHPFPRSCENIRALATFRGATAGFNFAEAFMLIKEVW